MCEVSCFRYLYLSSNNRLAQMVGQVELAIYPREDMVEGREIRLKAKQTVRKRENMNVEASMDLSD